MLFNLYVLNSSFWFRILIFKSFNIYSDFSNEQKTSEEFKTFMGCFWIFLNTRKTQFWYSKFEFFDFRILDFNHYHFDLSFLVSEIDPLKKQRHWHYWQWQNWTRHRPHEIKSSRQLLENWVRQRLQRQSGSFLGTFGSILVIVRF